MNYSEVRAGVGVALPIQNLDNVITFDENLKKNKRRKAKGRGNFTMSLYRVSVCGESSAKGCITKIMTVTIGKSVEIYFSGTGRLIKNIGKTNFSSTSTYSCLEDMLVEKFGDSNDGKNFKGKVGRWLSGAGDRNGGRTNQYKNDTDNGNAAIASNAAIKKSTSGE